MKEIVSRMRKCIFKFFLFQILNYVIIQCRSREGVRYTLLTTRKSRIEARDAVVYCCTLLDSATLIVAPIANCCPYSQLLPLQRLQPL